ncbi:MAG TPA: hypothetical protein DIC45_13470 [Comamonadaceae bacterium]|uniref:hemerythrin domain-containing protein n=1 Tax=Pulveribacter sp. TaxID=2678893 RepID=UPI000EC20B2B|nr:hypothetical protein [Pulveribacter sp.]HCL87468.1 hypothetical protein [Comamonadaceae bacterium]
MKMDPREIAEIAAAQAAQPRLDLYAGIHKALRAFMADTLLAVGRMDVHDDLERAQACQQLLELLALCRSHLDHENHFVHTAMQARAPGSSERVEDEHAQHQRDIARLAVGTHALLAAGSAERAALAHALYTGLAAFVGHNYAHMQVEETEHNAVLWAHYSDEELMGLHNALVASIPPQEMMLTMRWMIPSVSPAERAAILGDMRAHAPAPAFAAVLDAVRPHLTQAARARLEQALAA